MAAVTGWPRFAREWAPKTWDLQERCIVLWEALLPHRTALCTEMRDEIFGLIPSLGAHIYRRQELDAEFLQELRVKLDRAAELAGVTL